MESITHYQDWPKYVKAVTAMSHPKFVFKKPTLNFVLGYLLVVPAIIAILISLFTSAEVDKMSQLSNIGYVFVGLGNIIAGYAIKWIANNSSWDERFRNKSGVDDKLIWLLVTIGLLASLYFIFRY